MKQFARKLKSLIVKLITRKLVHTNKSSIVLHPTRLKQVMKIKKNVPPITRNIVNPATTTERNATKYQRRSVITSRYQNIIKYHKNIAAMSRSQNATKYQSSIAQKHINKNATKFPLKYHTKSPTKVATGLRNHTTQMITTVNSSSRRINQGPSIIYSSIYSTRLPLELTIENQFIKKVKLINCCSPNGYAVLKRNIQ